MEDWIWAVWDDSEPDGDDSAAEVAQSLLPTLLKYVLYRSTTVLNMTVTKVERAVKRRGWEKRRRRRRRRRRTWSLRKIDFDLNTLKLISMKIKNSS